MIIDDTIEHKTTQLLCSSTLPPHLSNTIFHIVSEIDVRMRMEYFASFWLYCMEHKSVYLFLYLVIFVGTVFAWMGVSALGPDLVWSECSRSFLRMCQTWTETRIEVQLFALAFCGRNACLCVSLYAHAHTFCSHAVSLRLRWWEGQQAGW